MSERDRVRKQKERKEDGFLKVRSRRSVLAKRGARFATGNRNSLGGICRGSEEHRPTEVSRALHGSVGKTIRWEQ